MRRRTIGAGAALLLMPKARAQAVWPSQPVRIIVPFPAGGTADVLPRIVAEGLRPIWKQPIIIENRPGAAGNIGTAVVAGAEPDGHTLLAAPPPPIAINQHLYANLTFDPSAMKPITIMGAAPNVVGVSNRLGVASLAELIGRAKARPGTINAANQGIGTTSHLTALLFETLTGIRFNHVPYSGTAPALNDLVARHVDVFFDNISSSLSHHQAGAIRILAVCSAERARPLPEIPTVSEAALPGFSATAWFAIMAPRGTLDAVISRVNEDVVSVIRQPEVRRRFEDQAAQPIGNTSPEAADFIAAESRLWDDVVRRTGLHLGR